jgi:uncharacterized protein (DUF58 family)
MMKFQVQLQQNVIPLIIAFLLGLQLMEPSRIWTILLGGIGGAWLAAYVWASSLGRNLQLRRETRFGWEQVGGQIEERFTLSNHSLFPALWVNLIDQSTLPGYQIDDTFRIGSGSFAQWSSTGICTQRGLYYLGGAILQTGDPFGIFQVTIYDHFRTPLVVLPQIIDLPPLQISESGFQGEGRPRPNAPIQSISSANVREYQHGDGVKLIHWPTTARMNKVYVRQMESAPEGDWWIMLDLDRLTMIGEGWDSIEEQSVSLAASLADFGLRVHKSVGLISNGADLIWLAPKKGDGQRWEIMYTLALAKPGNQELAYLLEHVRPTLGQHRSLIIITAATRLDWLKTLHPLSKKGIVPTVLMLDPATFGGKYTNQSSISALQERGITCHLISRNMLHLPPAQPHERADWKWKHTPSGGILPTQVFERSTYRAKFK